MAYTAHPLHDHDSSEFIPDRSAIDSHRRQQPCARLDDSGMEVVRSAKPSPFSGIYEPDVEAFSRVLAELDARLIEQTEID